MLKFCNFKSKSLGGYNSVICNPIWILRLLANFYCIKELRQHIIILICGHMAQNPLFWDACIMCLMGDIQKQTYFLSCYRVHLDIGSTRIVIYVFLLRLHFPTSKISTFQWFQNSEFCKLFSRWYKLIWSCASNSRNFFHNRNLWNLHQP